MNDISDFEPETRAYLKRIIKSIFITLPWMMTNIMAGLYYEYAIIHEKISTGNILFYSFFLVSFVALIWYLIKLWKGHL
jgi:hypothetical protein